MVSQVLFNLNLILQLSGLFSKPKVTIEIETDEKRKPYKIISQTGEITRLPALYDKEDVKGKVIVSLGSPKIFEHKGIKLELIGMIENLKDKKDSTKFLSLTNELSPIGILTMNPLHSLSLSQVFKNNSRLIKEQWSMLNTF